MYIYTIVINNLELPELSYLEIVYMKFKNKKIPLHAFDLNNNYFKLEFTWRMNSVKYLLNDVSLFTFETFKNNVN